MVYLKEGRKIMNKECRKLCEVKNDREFYLLNI